VIRHRDDFTLTRIHIFYLGHDVGFQLRRWALKIMSFMISANRLFILTQSHRLRKLLEGDFFIQVLSSPTTRPYHCDLSPGTIQVVLDAALAETSYFNADWEEARKSFIGLCSKESAVIRWRPRVHAELAMDIAMVEGKIEPLPYIGVSKLSCIMCSHYIRAFREITGQKITTRGSHGKAYPGWFWPSHPDFDCDTALRQAFLIAIRGQLCSNFEDTFVCRKSDSSVGSDGPRLQLHPTQDKISALFKQVVSPTA
jgi:hypothetical protein